MDDYLLNHIVSMIHCRRVREALGFNVERCIRRKIPPCRLPPLEPLFQAHLNIRCSCRVSPIQYTNVYYPDTHTLVGVSVCVESELIKLHIITNVSVCTVERASKVFNMFTYGPNSTHRAYYMNMCLALCVSLGPTNILPRAILQHRETNPLIWK